VTSSAFLKRSFVTGLAVIAILCSLTASAARTAGEPSFLLNVSLNGDGAVTSNPPGIKCTTGNRGTCQKTFREGTEVALTATPASGWQFSHWAGCDSVNGHQCTLTMSASKTCTATFNTTWAKTYGGEKGDAAYSIQQTSDGGYIVAGYTNSFGAGKNDFWVLKLNARGDVVWQKAYGGADDDYAYSIQQTSDGGYIVAGSTWSFGAGENDLWVLKLDPTGKVVWQKTWGGRFRDSAISVQQTFDGGYIMAGNTSSFAADWYDLQVLKLDATGDVVWQKTYGGAHWDEADSIQETADGGYIVAGFTYSFGAGESDVWVLKLDARGNVVWQKTYGGRREDSASSIRQTSDGGYIVGGSTRTFDPAFGDVGLLKLDARGNVVWQRTYGGRGLDEATSIQQTSDGGYIVAGSTWSFGAGNYDVWVLKLDARGNVVWQRTYGGRGLDEATSIRQTSDGGYIVAGSTWSFGAGNYDVWVLKLDANGNVANCTPSTLLQESDGHSKRASIKRFISRATAVSASPTIAKTNVSGRNSKATVATQCPG
jgi:uncharacterized delta-60 repeat protein